MLALMCITNINAETKEAIESSEIVFGESINETNQKNSSDPFDIVMNMKGVSVVYISKAMLGMMPNMGNMPGINIGNVAGKLESMYVISAESKSSAESLNKATTKLLSNGTYETLMMVKDDDSLVNFYLKKGEKSNSEILMVTKESDEVTIIRFIGSFTLQDIQNLTKEK